MKKHIFFFTFIFLSITSLQGQTSFKDYLNIQGVSANNCSNKKDYNCVISIFEAIIVEYNSLSDKEKGDYKWVLGELYYNLACCHALTEKPDESLINFENAIKNGYINYTHAKTDPDLESIRDYPKFKELLTSIHEVGDYTYILQKSGPYMKEPPVFTYESSTSPDLRKIREYFKLDSIAGNGNEFSKILNLMTWVHNTIPHDGSYWANINMTAISIYEHSKNNNTGMNCRSQAIFLNECYLALGIKSRYVTCSPRDNYKKEAHVINAVYSTDLNKWIWIDPTFNTYVKDDKGTFLNINEVRDRVIKEQPLFISDSANWNNKQKYTKEMYIDNYMTKLLYWFNCPSVNKYGTDNDWGSNYSVSLLPSDFSKDKSKFEYFTNDEDYFWEGQ